MIETDGQDSATCQNPREGTWMAFLEFLMIIRTKLQIVIIFFLQKQEEMCRGKRKFTVSLGFYFSERVSNFSLKSRVIRSLEFFGPRSKAVLGREGFVWVPVFRSFNKLHEVGVLSYLSYTLFKCFVGD